MWQKKRPKSPNYKGKSYWNGKASRNIKIWSQSRNEIYKPKGIGEISTGFLHDAMNLHIRTSGIWPEDFTKVLRDPSERKQGTKVDRTLNKSDDA